MRATGNNLYHLFRCVKATAPGGSSVLKTDDFPINGLKLRDDESLVRMSFAGVNFIDTYYRSGLYTKTPSPHHAARMRGSGSSGDHSSSFPYIVGEEGSGAVVQCGSPSLKANWLNKRVAFIANELGSYSSFTVVREKDLFEIPKEVDDKTAAAVMLQGCTAHYLTHDTYAVRKGDTVLVHAAAGGTGLLVSQMAKHLGAGRVIGVCGGAEKAALAKSVGKCDDVVDYLATPEWEKEVRRLEGNGCHVVYDGVGKSTFASSLKCLRPRGTMVSFGNASGAVDPVAPLTLTAHGSLFLARPKLADHMADRSEAERRVAEVFGMVASGSLAVQIHGHHKLEKAAKAHDLLEGRGTMGKVLINCQE